MASWNLSLQYVKSHNCTLVLGLNGDLTFGGMPAKYKMSWHAHVGQLHFGTQHAHGTLFCLISVGYHFELRIAIAL